MKKQMRFFQTIVFLLLCGLFSTSDGSSAENRPEEKSTKERSYSKYVGEGNYDLPFKTRLSEPLREGQTIHAIGRIVKDPKRIDLTFHKGGNDDDDMPLHLSVRFNEGIFTGSIVYNIFENKNWSLTEERISSPYKAGEDFDIRVRIIGGKFQVFGNRHEIGTFEQRLPIQGVNHVSITGDLEKIRLFHYGGSIFANPYHAIAKLMPGKRLDISALPTGKQINVNLYRADGEYALHISIRFSEGAIVRNAMKDNNWGKEEREGGFPLSRNEMYVLANVITFDLTIVNEPVSFQIFLNGKRFCTFAHRSSPNDIETLDVDGSVDLHTVTITDVQA